jgi:hypothetical protein
VRLRRESRRARITRFGGSARQLPGQQMRSVRGFCPLPDRAGTDSVIVPPVARVVLPSSVNENLTPEIPESIG